MPPSRPGVAEASATSRVFIDIGELLAACVDAARRSCDVIRRVQAAREAGESIGESYKDLADPRSALTVADTQAQAAIVVPLRRQFPGLTIVGEEDDDDDNDGEGNAGGTDASSPLLTSCVELETPEGLRKVDVEDVCVFCDPLDGTLEFVEGRLESVQTLIGISVKGEPVAGVIGRPFVCEELIYGIVGSGVVNLPDNSGNREDRDGLLLASSQSSVQGVLKSATAVIAPAKLLPYGGAGNKMLQVATGAVDICVLNLITSLWDTAATQAIITASGGTVTDLFGNSIAHHAHSRVKNIYGVLASNKRLSMHDVAGRTHKSICKQLRESMVLDVLLIPTGLSTDVKPQATDIARDIEGNPLTREWFSAFLPTPVASFTADEAHAVRYLMSDACRIRLQYVNENEAKAERCPTSVFMKRIVMKHLEHVKLKARTAPAKLARDVTSYQVEASFLASEACRALSASGTRVVKPYHIDARPASMGESPIESRFLLVLEDFNPDDGWSQAGLLDRDRMLATLNSLASMHAFFWNYGADPCYEEMSACVWDQGTYWTPERQAADSFSKIPRCWETQSNSFREYLDKLKVADGGNMDLEDFGRKLALASPSCAEKVHGVGLDASHPQRTLIHGDAKAANFFYRENKNTSAKAEPLADEIIGRWEVGMIDFQWCGWGHPAVDIAYLVAASAAPELLSHDGGKEAGLLRVYRGRLLHFLVKHGKAKNHEDAEKLMSMDDLQSYYDDAIIDLARLVVSYHWDRIGASPDVLKSRAGQLGSNAYNKDIECAMWLIARTALLLEQRDTES